MTTAQRTTTVSVCMATYNGAQWVGEQLQSILDELEPGDEVVVVDDASRDDTVAVIEAVADPRVRVHRSAVNRGYVATFQDALARAVGDVVLLSDQDDVWIPGRRGVLVDAVASHGVAASNVVLLGSDAPLRSPITGRPWRLRSSTSRQRRRNALRLLAGIAPYYGCAMAIRRDALPLVLPFPAGLTESHDLWIASAANAAGALVHVDAPTVRRRVHGGNASTERPRGVRAALRSRALVLRLLAEGSRRARALGPTGRRLLGAR